MIYAFLLGGKTRFEFLKYWSINPLRYNSLLMFGTTLLQSTNFIKCSKQEKNNSNIRLCIFILDLGVT